MKYLLLLILAMQLTYAQDKISISILQDSKLLISGDTHGNSPSTFDLILSADLEGQQLNWYYFSMRAQYEQADLYSGMFYRYSVQSIWTFNKLFIPNLELGTGIGLSMIHRGGTIKTPGLGSYSFIGELSYPISKKLRMLVRNEFIHRADLVYWYNETNPLKYNLSAGLELSI